MKYTQKYVKKKIYKQSVTYMMQNRYFMKSSIVPFWWTYTSYLNLYDNYAKLYFKKDFEEKVHIIHNTRRKIHLQMTEFVQRLFSSGVCEIIYKVQT